MEKFIILWINQHIDIIKYAAIVLGFIYFFFYGALSWELGKYIGLLVGLIFILLGTLSELILRYWYDNKVKYGTNRN